MTIEVPEGYGETRKVGRRISVETRQAIEVAWPYRKEGRSNTFIADSLNRLGYRTATGLEWSGSSVNRILEVEEDRIGTFEEIGQVESELVKALADLDQKKADRRKTEIDQFQADLCFPCQQVEEARKAYQLALDRIEVLADRLDLMTKDSSWTEAYMKELDRKQKWKERNRN